MKYGEFLKIFNDNVITAEVVYYSDKFNDNVSTNGE